MLTRHVLALAMLGQACGAAATDSPTTTPAATPDEATTSPPASEAASPLRLFAEQVIIGRGAAEQSRGAPTEASVIEAAELWANAAIHAAEIAEQAGVANVANASGAAAERLRASTAALQSQIDTSSTPRAHDGERHARRMELEEELTNRIGFLSSQLSELGEALSQPDWQWPGLCACARVGIFTDAAAAAADATLDGADASRLEALITFREAARDLNADLDADPFITLEPESSEGGDRAREACGRAPL